MKSRFLVGFAALLLAAALPRLCRAQAPALYSIINVNPVGLNGSPTGINDDDQIVGFDSGGFGFLWMPGVPSFHFDTTNTPNYAFAINNLGQIAGEFVFTNGVSNAGVWSPQGYLSKSYSITNGFGATGVGPSALNAVNDDSNAAGFIGAGLGTGTPPGTQNAIETNALQASTIADPDTTLNGVSNIYEDTCGAETTNASPAIQYAVWIPNFSTHNGAGAVDMSGSTFGTATFGAPASALAIDDGENMVGYSQNSLTGHIEAFAWDGPTDVSYGPLGYLPHSTYSVANAINSITGEIVGQSGTRAFLWTGDVTAPQFGVMTDMNTLIAPHSGWLLRDATAVNDYGDIVGTGFYHQAPAGFLAIPTVLQSISLDSTTFSQSHSGSITGSVTFTNPAPFDLGVTVSLYNESTGQYATTVSTRVLAGATTAEYRIPIPSSPTITVPEAYLVKATFGGARAYSAFKLTP